MVTIREVAAAAGVSIATVSRALADPDKVAAGTRDRVLSAIDTLGYTPNRAASGLRAGRTNTIGLLVPDLTNPYFSGVARGVTAQATDEGVSVFVTESREDPAAEVEILRGLVRQTDGVVLCSPRAVHDDRGVIGPRPLVLINNELPGAQSISVDDRHGIREALRHLYALGHRRIGYVGGPSGSWSDRRRRAALAAHAPELAGVQIVDLGEHEATVQGGDSAAGEVIAAEVTAVIAFNDIVAVGLIRRLHRMGVRVPHELSVVGFDNTFLADLVTPALTTVHGDLETLGRRATDLLLGVLPGRPVRAAVPHLLPARLVVRDSTAPLRARLPAGYGSGS
ncbi:LacI family DNA-binding transcriptional regulator [Micropruina sonneratiae]|uniref:LacI family DNA-binding transcriptional regulator n=1 Tax=Micropruina sonneratiae TaxID=2986940 RepID=UPI002227D8D3|nr:LacI family DNA-binding transcriptional regulator [Micropruina sp. KQZ13P-5]MCW3159045.1 LacI family transcriptional regulator [Micropruina sp. KQZ13P-5]